MLNSLFSSFPFFFPLFHSSLYINLTPAGEQTGCKSGALVQDKCMVEGRSGGVGGGVSGCLLE